MCMFQPRYSSSFISSNYRATEQLSWSYGISNLGNTGKVKAIDVISITEPFLIQENCGITAWQCHFSCKGSTCSLKATFVCSAASYRTETAAEKTQYTVLTLKIERLCNSPALGVGNLCESTARSAMGAVQGACHEDRQLQTMPEGCAGASACLSPLLGSTLYGGLRDTLLHCTLPVAAVPAALLMPVSSHHEEEEAVQTAPVS